MVRNHFSILVTTQTETNEVESVIIGEKLGLQLTTTYAFGRQTNVFVSANRMKNIVINEGFQSVGKRFKEKH